MARPKTRIYLEEGKTWVFAAALDWPGWCRRGKGAEAAIDALVSYANRYAAVAGPSFSAIPGFTTGSIEVIGRVAGNSTTDFGAPGVTGPWDDEPLDAPEADRQVSLLEACWRCLDEVVVSAPSELRKGPRGGGRDRDAIVDHVREAERSYSGKIGVRIPPRTPWPEQRAMIAASLRSQTPSAAWPIRYLIRRSAWHILDHAWEIEDKSIVTN